ncbi:MFS general substrate transporter [Annulohypoxylon maeteangense]|uniref:MFS general substrate transporter n=1 Tax=Annulohypoxylon maeteangense TaxID=1927788 RepID=UPI0020082A64|nr:MFS general substrate transporter [Annulohypoxylon maeteangense]KAI0888064.1 MFS general substrate transporter [Annulohypoxylon maeteangense]
MAEKEASVSLHEKLDNDAPSASEEGGGPAHDSIFEKRVLRKIDIRLLPILGALYTIAMIDRSNISVARISGLDEDVGLAVGDRASIALLVFFIGYMLFELPSNMIIHRVGAANWISLIVFAWGLVSMGIGFLNNWVALAVLRSFLGVFEAGFYPGCVYLISSWYRRYEVQKRLATFFMTGSALSAFANILALGLIQISKVHPSYKGWRWIYIIEGIMTCVAAVIAWFVIVDFPDSDRNTFLSEEESAFVKARLAEDRGTEEREKVTWAVFVETATDWKVWSFALMYSAGAVGVYAFLFFLPIILRNGMGYSQDLAFVLSAPPALFSVVEGMFVSWLADKMRLRGPFVIVQGLVAIVGLCMTGFINNPVARYVGTFLGEAGVNGLVVTTLAWQANNLRGDAKRACATAFMIAVSGLGGIYSSLVFRQQDAPDYIPGIIAVMAICIAAVVAACISIVLLRLENKRADEGKKIIDGLANFRWTI